jgi:hypothetical protein
LGGSGERWGVPILAKLAQVKVVANQNYLRRLGCFDDVHRNLDGLLIMYRF